MEAQEITEVRVGDVVTYVDPRGKPHCALVTAVWGHFGEKSYREVYTDDQIEAHKKYHADFDPDQVMPSVVPSLNVVYVSDDENATDPYGRQIAERATSIPHESVQPAHGMHWINYG